MAVSHLLTHPFRFTISTFKLLCALHLFQTHVFEVGPAQGPSMLPTFSIDGDWIAADKTHARNRRGALRVGDLVMYRIPVSPDAMGIKRLVGLPGDYVSIGTPGQGGQEYMIQSSILTEPKSQVPDGHCWIVGDNLPASRDSRAFGPVPLALVTGKVVARCLPFRDAGWFENGLQPVKNDS
ncbi:Mitochondrial inner membrane protease subunit-like protein [Hapsidospora chrysogenum ATCC 11550]|uniref:Mitochondrial inner membrane protease subunit n=1 Tax=Hapsidospora chrysogenum (strain ATCC 11550 / CBS 779.69 / DSM 880 / IAM 14645 / JCM 23072 / IMI 49137) TaxID=857340 RepID=A0A086T2R5_HAPC1|nr:Mitochondrial inner membrane protease subunit-like protein [Hapsidospora chrysogenum ATCC 11550]